MNAPHPSTPRGVAAAAADGSNPLRISLFSLGNMCAHKECADALLQLGINNSLMKLRSSPDATVQKYVQRIQVLQPQRVARVKDLSSCGVVVRPRTPAWLLPFPAGTCGEWHKGYNAMQHNQHR